MVMATNLSTLFLNRLPNRCWGRLGGPFPSDASLPAVRLICTAPAPPPPQAQEMQDKARAMAGNNRLYLLDFELRCVPAVRRMRELVGCGRIGAVQFIGVSVLANFGFLADGATHSHWAMRECGGGVFSAVGTHMVDVCRFVLSDEVARVSATEAPLVATLPDAEGVARPVTADGYVAAQLRMRDTGTPVQITISGRTPGVGKMYENRMVCPPPRGGGGGCTCSSSGGGGADISGPVPPPPPFEDPPPTHTNMALYEEGLLTWALARGWGEGDLRGRPAMRVSHARAPLFGRWGFTPCGAWVVVPHGCAR